MQQWHMLKRFYAFIIFMLLPLSTYAVGMGRITVQSALGAPFRAEIPLKDLAGVDASTLSAKMAGADAFKQAGIPYATTLYAIRFKVDTHPGATPRIVLTSTQPVSDPFLNLLVELQWPSGQLLREYTVLLDPPGYGGKREAIAPVALPSAPTPAAGPVRAAAPAMQPAAMAPSRYGPVKQGDTLFSIAKQLKPAGVTVEQMLAALYQRNPGAFAGHNMNRLMAGKVLTVPRANEAAAVGRQGAAREIRRQAANWRAYRKRLAAAASAVAERKAAKQTAAGKITPVVKSGAEGQEAASDVLKLSRGSAAGQTGAVGAGGKQALQQQIQSLQEDAIAKEKTIQDANARIAALEKTIKDMRRLLTLKGEALPAQATEKAAPKPAAKPRAAPSLVERIMENPVYLGGSVAGAVLVLALALWGVGKARRKRMEKFMRGAGTESDLSTSAVIGKASGGSVNTDTSFLTDFSQAGLGTIDTNEVDPIAEAEVYIAYGRDGQAEDILKEAMGKDPHRYEIHLKLLEIYAARKEAETFEALARELYTALDGQQSPLWDKAAQMGHALDPENPLYRRETTEEDLSKTLIISPEAAAEARAASAPLDVDLGEAVQEEDVIEVGAASGESAGLDFVVDEAAEKGPADEMAAEAESALDIDLGETVVPSPEEAPSLAVDESHDLTGMDDIMEMADLAEAPEGEAADLSAPLEIDLGEAPAAVGATEEEQENALVEAEESLDATALEEISPIEEAAPDIEVAGLPEEALAEVSTEAEESVETATVEETPLTEEAAPDSEAAGLQEEAPAEVSTESEENAEAAVLEEIPSVEEAVTDSEAAGLQEETPAEVSTEDEEGVEAAAPEDIPSVEEVVADSEADGLQEEALAEASTDGEESAEAAALEETPPAEEAAPDIEAAELPEEAPAEVSTEDEESAETAASEETPSVEELAPGAAVVEMDEVAEAPVLDEAVTPSPSSDEVVEDIEITPLPGGEEEDAGQGEAQTPPLDLDFNLDEPEEAAPEPQSPPLDLAGIDLDLEAPPAASETVAEETAESDAPHWQESATKLDLARAYMEMGDSEGAREILDEVAAEGNVKQRQDAKDLLAKLS
ncbi:MAG TPA: hypothetical protein DEP05_05825 [Betaproteobacteria bacterium]|nr:hypothetical protein [Betaproteobacteria bacterium]